MQNKTAEFQYYLTPKYDTPLEAWKDLGKHLEQTKWCTIFMRDPPEVSTQLNFDTKKDESRGYVRYAIIGKLEDSDRINIPSIGQA